MFKINTDDRIDRAIKAFIKLTVRDGLFVLFAGTLARFFYRWRPEHNPLLGMATSWNEQVFAECLEPIGVRCTIETDLEMNDFSGLTVVLCNHPHTLESTIPPLITLRKISSRIIMVIKSSQVFQPIGMALWMLDAAVIVNRLYMMWPFRLWPALALLMKHYSMIWYRRQLQHVHAEAVRRNEPIALLMFLNRRWTQERYEKELAKFTDSVPGSDTWLQYGLIAKSGGLYEVLQATGHIGIRVVSLTMASTARHDRKSTSFKAMGGVKQLVKIEDVTIQLHTMADGTDLRQITEPQLRTWLNLTLWPHMMVDIIRPWCNKHTETE
ncbi:MAG: hypothetical protein Q8P90_00265 [bacterium]|nr:hypothetical protein [bacterium]